MGFALPAGQVKAVFLALRVSSLKQSLNWKKVCSPEEEGEFPGRQRGHVSGSAQGLLLECSQLLHKAAVSKHRQCSLKG